MNIDDDLTPEERAEERALAVRLARLGPEREPAPALDARILAAARTAVQPPRAPARRRRPAKWPAVFGVAASLAFALGVAWKLRPQPELPTASQAASTTEDNLADFRSPPPAEVYAPRPKRVLEVPAPPPAEAPARTRGPDAAKPRLVRRADVGAEPPYAFEAAPAAAPPPAPPPPVPTPVDASPTFSAPAAPPADTAQRREAAEAGAARAAAQEARTQDLRKAADAVAADEPESAEPDEEVVPPATADSPAVRDAWLQRIRDLAKAGRHDDARASLREFRHRYPGFALPDDLRALGE